MTTDNQVEDTGKAVFRFCIRCGNQFEARHGNGGEPQKYCSRDCQWRYYNSQKLKAIKGGHNAE